MATPEQTLRRQAVARRIVYLLVAAAVVVPLIHPVELPGEPSQWARKLHDRLNRLEPGSPVLFSFDYDPASKAELYPMSLALLQHCFQRDLHPVVMTHWPNGVGLCKELVETAAEFNQIHASLKAIEPPGVFHAFLDFETQVVRQIGNAVPVNTARELLQCLIAQTLHLLGVAA